VLGAFSIGTLTFLAGSFPRSRDLIQRVLLALSNIYEQNLYLSHLFTFSNVRPSVVSNRGRRLPRPIARGSRSKRGFRIPV